jgi:hypothetical protein
LYIIVYHNYDGDCDYNNDITSPVVHKITGATMARGLGPDHSRWGSSWGYDLEAEPMVEMVKSYNRNPNNNDGKMDGKSCFLREKLIEKTKKCQKKDGNDGKHVFPYGKID